MSCNRAGVQCQPAATLVGAGDTELIQMTGRRCGGNCKVCGGWLRKEDGGCTRCENQQHGNRPEAHVVVGLFNGSPDQVHIFYGHDAAARAYADIYHAYLTTPTGSGGDHTVAVVPLKKLPAPNQDGRIPLRIDYRDLGNIRVKAATEKEQTGPRPVEGTMIFEADQPRPTIESVLNRAIAADERSPFVIVEGREDYIRCRSPEEAVRYAKLYDGAAYIYDPNHHPANDPRTPIAVYAEGRLGMSRSGWAQQVRAIEREENLAESCDRVLAMAEEYEEMGRDLPPDGLDDLKDAVSRFRDKKIDDEKVAAVVEAGRVLLKDAREYAQMGRDIPTWGAGNPIEPLRQAMAEYSRSRPTERVVGLLVRLRQDMDEDGRDAGFYDWEVDTHCRDLTRVSQEAFGLKGEIYMVWKNADGRGFRGEARLYYVEKEGDVTKGYPLPTPFRRDSQPAEFVEALKGISGGKARPRIWSKPLYQQGYNLAETKGKE